MRCRKQPIPSVWKSLRQAECFPALGSTLTYLLKANRQHHFAIIEFQPSGPECGMPNVTSPLILSAFGNGGQHFAFSEALLFRSVLKRIVSVNRGHARQWRKVSRVRHIGSDCISGDKHSRSVAIQVDTAELVSQTVTLRRPRALLPAIIGCDLFAARKTVRRDTGPACLLPLPSRCRLLPPPATSAAAACFAKTRPEVARVWRPSWGGF